jgi:regulator of PEP synthase PpsR (kinase-PPPase family)
VTAVPRSVFCVSDHTGITAEAFAHSLMTRFDGVAVDYVLRPFTNSAERVDAVIAEVTVKASAGPRPIIFSTLTNRVLRDRLKQSDALVLGLFDHFIDDLSRELERSASDTVGSYHGIRDLARYQARLDAVDFSLATDDGLGLRHYSDADVILVGVSRVGKTPTSLYMAMHHGISTANYPLTHDDLSSPRLPAALQEHRSRLFGLTIDPIRLHQIRQKRRPDSEYSSLPMCTDEVNAAEQLMRRESIASVNTTTQSIEEIAATIMGSAELRSRLG